MLLCAMSIFITIQLIVSIPYQQVNKCYNMKTLSEIKNQTKFQSLISRSINVTDFYKIEALRKNIVSIPYQQVNKCYRCQL